MDFKYYMMMLGTLAIAAAIGSSISDYTNATIATNASQSGLEECPNLLGHTGDTIWVKNCSENLKNQHQTVLRKSKK